MLQFHSEMSVLKSYSLLVAVVFSVCIFETFAENTPVVSLPKVIFDTDLDSDVDDIGALAMLLNLHKAGVIELAGVIVTSDDPYAPVCASAINTFYGLPGIPVGFLKSQHRLNNHSRYTRFIAEEFPSCLKTWQDAEDAVLLYRRLLAGYSQEEVVIITVGHLTSLQGLLQSGPDEISPLTGEELVNSRVKQWICMGGHYPEGKEANFYRPDPLSTVYCVKNWKKEVLFCGWEAGNPVITGADRLKNALAPGHPVYRGYELYNGFAGRQSWDQVAVLMMLEVSGQFFTFVNGTCMVARNGSNTWENNPSGPHSYVVINPLVGPEIISKYIDQLMAGECVH